MRSDWTLANKGFFTYLALVNRVFRDYFVCSTSNVPAEAWIPHFCGLAIWCDISCFAIEVLRCLILAGIRQAVKVKAGQWVSGCPRVPICSLLVAAWKQTDRKWCFCWLLLYPYRNLRNKRFPFAQSLVICAFKIFLRCFFSCCQLSKAWVPVLYLHPFNEFVGSYLGSSDCSSYRFFWVYMVAVL